MDETAEETYEIELQNNTPVQKRKRVVRKKESKNSLSNSVSESREAPVRSSRKRVSSNPSQDSDGPITKSKKRTLKSDANLTKTVDQPKIRTRAVKTENLESKPKTRRVRKATTQIDEMDMALERITSQLNEEE